ncbi:Error-prone repair homolog of DNA polymerase III alpha subunit [Citrifermentans bremense]|uniref:DNA-directed DNA polymerase n=1 Tax=Citrifermentans bremense TaxID=60035 RepID=A0A6S6LUU8_9BACT|nr:DNA polymerase III subunit alpha [Citrifermentans bremense]BCG45747.1 Error-prone repair homolog of DNA polymerase III alpha subunit [Citrifermentans bremense]
MFIHLHAHSSLSPNWGVHSPEALCSHAALLGFKTLAITDRNGLYGVPRFLDVAREAGIAPIIGTEAVTQNNRAVLLASNEEGYANISRLISDLHCQKNFDLVQAISEYRRGIIVLSDDRKLLSVLKQQSDEGLFVELSPGHAMHTALTLARDLRLPPVATSRALLRATRYGRQAPPSDAFSSVTVGSDTLTPPLDDFHLHRVLRAIHLNTKLSRLKPEMTATESDVLYPPQKMAEFFPHCPEALQNTLRIASLCKTDWDFSSIIFPAFRELGTEAAFETLLERARQGAIWRYGCITDQVQARLDKELSIIRDKGFSHYFLVVEELTKQSERTCGRGSAAASLVAYCLGITHVDPIRHNLFFERFLNEGRSDPPDIDVDFPWDERDAILDFAFARYGARRAAMVANQVGFKGRSALREVAKVYGLPDYEIKEMTERISGFWRAEQSAAAVNGHPLFKGETLSSDWQEIISTARRLNGQLRHLSLHCGGLVIVPDEIRKYVPVEISHKGLPLIQWEKDQTEDAGLVKIDILGNRSLAVIRDAMAAVKEQKGIDIDYATWRPLEDERTQSLLRRGLTIGCFYLESPSVRLLLRKIWSTTAPPETFRHDLFEVLVQASSIIRPAANSFIQEYVARLQGKPWSHLHPLLESVLGETLGIAIYQEQITQIAMELAGFSASEGDQLRKVITKKHREKRLADFRAKFMAGGAERGVSEKVLLGIWDQILSFAGYSFCKPHSASYALLSGKAAYMKANHPAQFIAAVISNQGGYYSPFAYISEGRRLGLAILPPDINESEYHYTGKEKTLRVGLMQIDGLTRDGADRLLKERREQGPFASFKEFLHRARLQRADAERLVKAGCFDALEGEEKRPALLWELLHFQQQATALLFEQKTELPHPPPYDAQLVLRQEVEALGFLVSRHPLALYKEQWQRHRPIKASELIRHSGKWVTMVGWWITTKTVEDKHGRPMEFISFEDVTSIFDATFFPDVYARFCRKLSQRRPYLLKGIVEEEFGVATLRVKWVGFLDG